MYKILFIALVATFTMGARNAAASINCKADFSSLKLGATAALSIADENAPKVSGFFTLDGDRHQFTDTSVDIYDIRPDFKIRDLDDLNPGEKRVALLSMYLMAPDTTAALHLLRPIDPTQITKVKIFNLIPNENMGGVKYVEFLNAQGVSLGKFFQAIALSTCN